MHITYCERNGLCLCGFLLYGVCFNMGCYVFYRNAYFSSLFGDYIVNLLYLTYPEGHCVCEKWHVSCLRVGKLKGSKTSLCLQPAERSLQCKVGRQAESRSARSYKGVFEGKTEISFVFVGPGEKGNKKYVLRFCRKQRSIRFQDQGMYLVRNKGLLLTLLCVHLLQQRCTGFLQISLQQLFLKTS